MKTFLLILGFVSVSGFGQTLCEKRLDSILASYVNNNIKITHVHLRECSYEKAQTAINANRVTNAPAIYASDACVIILERDQAFPELVIFDEENNLRVKRNFNRQNQEVIRSDLYGDYLSGTLLFIQKKGDYLNKEGDLNDVESISRINYSLETNKLRVLTWELGWVRNYYTHDYTLQCLPI